MSRSIIAIKIILLLFITSQSLQLCKFDSECGGLGYCRNSKCRCKEGASGDNCEITQCKGGCNNAGPCYHGKCQCGQWFRGKNCEISKCNGKDGKICNGHGTCNAYGECNCEVGYKGKTCEIEKCPNRCNSHGTCWKGKCNCYSGYSGRGCDVTECLGGCSPFQACWKGVCHCLNGKTGGNCDIARHESIFKRMKREKHWKLLNNQIHLIENSGSHFNSLIILVGLVISIII